MTIWVWRSSVQSQHLKEKKKKKMLAVSAQCQAQGPYVTTRDLFPFWFSLYVRWARLPDTTSRIHLCKSMCSLQPSFLWDLLPECLCPIHSQLCGILSCCLQSFLSFLVVLLYSGDFSFPFSVCWWFPIIPLALLKY